MNNLFLKLLSISFISFSLLSSSNLRSGDSGTSLGGGPASFDHSLICHRGSTPSGSFSSTNISESASLCDSDCGWTSYIVRDGSGAIVNSGSGGADTCEGASSSSTTGVSPSSSTSTTTTSSTGSSSTGLAPNSIGDDGANFSFSSTSCTDNRYFILCSGSSTPIGIKCSDVGNFALFQCLCKPNKFKSYYRSETAHATITSYGGTCDDANSNNSEFTSSNAVDNSSGDPSLSIYSTDSSAVTTDCSSQKLTSGKYDVVCKDGVVVKGVKVGAGTVACSCHGGLKRYETNSTISGTETYSHSYVCKDGFTASSSGLAAGFVITSTCAAHCGIDGYSITDSSGKVIKSKNSSGKTITCRAAVVTTTTTTTVGGTTTTTTTGSGSTTTTLSAGATTTTTSTTKATTTTTTFSEEGVDSGDGSSGSGGLSGASSTSGGSTSR